MEILWCSRSEDEFSLKDLAQFFDAARKEGAEIERKLPYGAWTYTEFSLPSRESRQNKWRVVRYGDD